MKRRTTMKGINWTKVRQITIGVFAFIVVSVVAFGTGTFHPNDYKLKKIKEGLEVVWVSQAMELGLHEPEFVYNDDDTFIKAVQKCVDYLNFTIKQENRIPSSVLIAMAGVESGWGTSRFATQGNALFGVRTWSEKVPQMKPLDLPNAKFGVKTYPTKCQSIKDVIDILNRHPAYKSFRQERERQQNNDNWDYNKLLQGIAPWSTNEKYVAIILETIERRQLP